jgi:hypothetical protein
MLERKVGCFKRERKGGNNGQSLATGVQSIFVIARLLFLFTLD